METKHTKGEWEYMTVGTVSGFYKKVFSEKTSICNITTRNFKEAEANAKLIASAPDLLEALIELYDSLPDGYESECLPKVRQAIKKATE